jgi:hypothetical protein
MGLRAHLACPGDRVHGQGRDAVAQRQHQAVAPGSEHRVEALHEGVELGWPGLAPAFRTSSKSNR